MSTFTIPGRLPGLNDYVRACRGNKYHAAVMKRECEEMVGWAIRADKPQAVHGPVFVAFRWVEPNRRRDLDNVRFAAKFVLDAMVDCGVIDADNCSTVLALTDSFAYDPANPRIEVTVEEAMMQ